MHKAQTFAVELGRTPTQNEPEPVDDLPRRLLPQLRELAPDTNAQLTHELMVLLHILEGQRAAVLFTTFKSLLPDASTCQIVL